MLLLLFLGCGVSWQQRSKGAVLRPATDVPLQFEAPAGMTLGSNSCLNPLTDIRDGTKITMYIFYGEGIGDYEVHIGKYGVHTGELLRVNCATGEILGIVRR